MAETFAKTLELLREERKDLADKIKNADAQVRTYEEYANTYRSVANLYRETDEDLKSAIKLLEGAFDSPAEQVAERGPNG